MSPMERAAESSCEAPRIALGQAVQRGISGLLELSLPGSCLLCGTPMGLRSEAFYPVCTSCLKRLPIPIGSRCVVCSRSLISEERICTRCRERRYHFTAHISACEYRDEAKELLAAYKFDNRRRVSRVIADILAPLIADQEVPVIPVPFRRKSRHLRGWDPVGEICRHLRRRHGIRVIRCLERTGGTPQKALGFEARRLNVAGRIRLRKRPGAGRFVLLDDVFTSGATLDECARVLIEGGAGEVLAVTFAID